MIVTQVKKTIFGVENIFGFKCAHNLKIGLIGWTTCLWDRDDSLNTTNILIINLNTIVTSNLDKLCLLETVNNCNYH